MIEQVKLFMELMGQDVPSVPTIPSQAIQQLRFGLIDEENKELADAAAAGDIVEVADALCDILYVAFGACLAYGFSPDLMRELFAEVQYSNMSKICKSEVEANVTAGGYWTNQKVECYVNQVGKYWTVVRSSDGKVLKSINYSEPDLKTILLKHNVKCD